MERPFHKMDIYQKSDTGEPSGVSPRILRLEFPVLGVLEEREFSARLQLPLLEILPDCFHVLIEASGVFVARIPYFGDNGIDSYFDSPKSIRGVASILILVW